MEQERIFQSKDYKKLLSYQRSEVIYLATYCFVERFMNKGDRTCDQMIQAARSGKQNIVEGAMASAGSKQSELFLTSVALASFHELQEDFLDYLKTRRLEIWDKDSEKVQYVRNLCRRGETYEVYREFVETRNAEVVANIVVTLIYQVEVLLSRQIKALEEKFLKEGGVKEKMMKMRLEYRDKSNNNKR